MATTTNAMHSLFLSYRFFSHEIDRCPWKAALNSLSLLVRYSTWYATSTTRANAKLRTIYADCFTQYRLAFTDSGVTRSTRGATHRLHLVNHIESVKYTYEYSAPRHQPTTVYKEPTHQNHQLHQNLSRVQHIRCNEQFVIVAIAPTWHYQPNM